MYTLLSGNRTSIWFRCFVSELCFFPFSAVTLSKVFILNRRIHYINSILLYTKRFFATYVEEVIWVCSLAWKIPWMEEPGRLQSMGSRRVGHTERLHFHFSLSCTGEGNGNPLQCSCLENPREGEPGGLPSMGSHRVGHAWSDLALTILRRMQ